MGEFVQDRDDSTFANRVGYLGPEHVDLGEGYAPRVLHRARVEFGDKELVILRKRIGEVELAFEVFEPLFGDVKDVVEIKEFRERLSDIDTKGNRPTVGRRELIVMRDIRTRDNRGDVRGNARGLRERPRGRCSVDGGCGCGGVRHDNPVSRGDNFEIESRFEVGLFKRGKHSSRVRHFELRIQVHLVVDGIDKAMEPFARVDIEHVGVDDENVLGGEIVELDPNAVRYGRSVKI